MLTKQKREELRQRVDQWFDLPLIAAAIALVILILVEATQPLEPPWDRYIEWIGMLIWSVFVLEFSLKLWLSPDRSAFLKKHWLDALAVALPPLRILRGVRALQVLVFSGRGASEFIERLRRRRLGKLAVISSFVVLSGGALLYLVEAGRTDSPVHSFGDALYWSTIAVLGSEGGLAMTTTAGRLIVLTLVAYSVVVFSYLVGALASLWMESDRLLWQESVREESRGGLPEATRESPPA